MKPLQDMMFILAKGIKKWDEDKGKIPDELYVGHGKLLQALVEKGKPFPETIHELLKFLKLPLEEWGMEAELFDLFPKETVLLIENYGLCDEVDGWLEETVSPDEKQQKHMLDILKLCRDNGYDQDYKAVRTFITENPVITFLQLSDFSNMINEDLQPLLKACYEPVNLPYHPIHLCPYCGWTLEKINHELSCSTNLCRQQSDFIYFPVLEQGKHFRLKKGIQRFVLLPGKSELKMAKSIEKKGYEVELYPEIDQFDIRVKKDNKVMDLDVKDYRYPHYLAQHLIETMSKQPGKYHESSYIVIPKYRIQSYPNYMQFLKKALKNSNIKVLTETECYKEIKKVLG